MMVGAPILTFLLLSRTVVGWHDLGNLDYHCWPIDASANKPLPFSDCPGIEVHWLEAPPDTIKAEESFNVTYQLNLNEKFYEWAVKPEHNFFKRADGGNGFTNASLAKEWCENTECPDTAKKAKPENCCIYHANVHSCPADVTEGGLCGPWIPPTGEIFTHSKVLHGPALTQNWTSYIKGFVHPGHTSVIGHFKVSLMHIAVEKTIVVRPKTVCGDKLCEDTEGESCETCPADCGSCGLSALELGILSASVVLCIIIILAIFMWFQWKRHKLLTDLTWIIPFEDLSDPQMGKNMTASTLSMASVATDGSNKSHGGSLRQKQVFTSTMLYNGQMIAAKNIAKSEFVVNKPLKTEVFNIRLLDHKNLNKFIGACVEPPNVCIITEYCPKGSLEDVLMDDNVPLNWSFRFSFASDIARGMAVLHTSMCHGHLSAHNCLMDDRWTVKISDYGLPILRTPEEGFDSETDEETRIKEERMRVYRAPELLSSASILGDVYGYGVILYMLASRTDPMQDATEITDSDKNTLYRINIDSLDLTSDTDQQMKCPCPFDYIKLIKDCNAIAVDNRPNFETIKKTIYRINPSKLSPVDLMMNLMEKYSKHLEQIVEERTHDLTLEKQKTDMLLYSMLPRAVADELRNGNSIGAIMFDICTIYFSDIVGFTTICGGSQPLEVVALLNNLYTVFDTIMGHHDVYKVETIGDAYMVVSGVPNLSATHAEEIINMALELVAASRVFVIPHMPDMPLKIRVGIHSGPVCAGVVGLKMPRYCLFGDTVNTASRMESNGEEYKIHTSNVTYEIVKTVYDFQYRGTIPVKGKGDMQTWWLLNKKGNAEVTDVTKL